HLAAVEAAPQLLEPGHADQRRLLGVGHAVERADRAPDDEVGGDAVLDERPQHPDLHGAEVPATAEHEGHWRRPAADALEQAWHRGASVPMYRSTSWEPLSCWATSRSD